MGDQAAGFAHPSSGDGGTRPAEQLADVARIAEAVRDVVSARATMVSRVVDADWLEVLVVAGTPSRDDLVGHRWRRVEFEALLQDAEQRGRLHLTARHSVTYVEVPQDAWHLPGLLGLLLAPLRNSRGDLVGVLTTEGPVDTVHPAPGVCDHVELYVDQARLAIEALYEHGVLAERLRLTDAGQSVLDDAVRADDLPAMLDAVTVGLAGMMRAAAWACAEVSPGVHAEAASYPAAVAERLGPEVCTLLEPLVEECRREGRVLTHETSPLLGRLARVTGHEQALLVALGDDEEARGALLLLRGHDDPPWSAAEHEAARAVARRVGTVVTRLEGRRRDRLVVDELRELDRYRRDLVASLTHDLKTPLTAISLNTELLEADRRLEEAGSHPVAAIRRSADRLAALVDDLLALARTEEGGVTGRTESGDVSEILREACRHAEVEAHLRGITFSVDMPEQLSAKVDVDALARVYANVVGNAVKFSLADGQVRLTLRRDGDVVELVCSDDGIGIPQEDQAAVFDMFRRSDDPLVRIVPGTGVGLAISHRIVTRIGGDIGLVSTPGEGSTFTVRVPG